MTTIDNVIDSIISPETTGEPIQDEVKRATALLGYSSGNSWPTYNPYEKARPDLAQKHWIIPVTLTCVGWGHMYDIEAGGGTNANIGVFMHNARNVWKTQNIWGPQWLYTFASNVNAMIAVARSFGYIQGKDYYVVCAHPGTRAGKHICAPNTCGENFHADMTQWLFARSYDSSILNDYMLRHPAVVKPPDAYGLFPTFVGDKSLPNNGNERLTVEQCDGALEGYHAHGLFHDYLKGQLFSEIKTYRDRCWRVANYLPPDFQRPNPHPAWVDKRLLGARWQGLNNRLKHINDIK